MREMGSSGRVGAWDLLLPLPLEEDEEEDIAIAITLMEIRLGRARDVR